MHKVSLNNKDVIEIIFHGDITEENIVPMAERVITLANELSIKNKPIKLLVDYSDVGKRSQSSKSFSAMAIRDINAEKFAALWLNKESKKQFLEVLKASGKSDTVKFFGSQHEAEAWLLEDD